MRLLVVLAALAQASAQRYFAGVSKNTWAAMDPSVCGAWLETYLPFLELEANECEGGVCPCGETARYHIANATGTSIQPDDEYDVFGLHTVNCTFHPAGQCAPGDVETALGAQIDAALRRGVFDPMLDNNVGMWVNDLDPLLNAFNRDGLPVLLTRWTDDDGAAYFGALVRPCGYVLLDFISNVTAWPRSEFVPSPTRMHFMEGAYNAATPPNALALAPLKVSRATTKLDRLVPFYVDVFGARVLHETPPTRDGTRGVTLLLPDTEYGRSLVHLQLWERRALSSAAAAATSAAPAPCAADDTWSVHAWERMLLDAHAKVMVSPTCGFDRWLDYHFAYDCLDATCVEDDYIAALARHNISSRWQPCPASACPVPNVPGINTTADGDAYFVYSHDPSGMGVQLHFFRWRDPPPVESIPPSCIRPPDFYNGSCPGETGGGWTCS